MSQPQSPQWYPPPPPPEKRGLSNGQIVAIVVAVIVVVVVVGAVIAGAFLAGVQNAATLSPNVALTDTHGTYYEHCGQYYSNTTDFDWSAVLVNTGGGGFVDIGYNVNGQQVSQNTYYVNARSQLAITQSTTLHDCYGSNTPTYRIVILAERSA